MNSCNISYTHLIRFNKTLVRTLSSQTSFKPDASRKLPLYGNEPSAHKHKVLILFLICPSRKPAGLHPDKIITSQNILDVTWSFIFIMKYPFDLSLSQCHLLIFFVKLSLCFGITLKFETYYFPDKVCFSFRFCLV